MHFISSFFKRCFCKIQVTDFVFMCKPALPPHAGSPTNNLHALRLQFSGCVPAFWAEHVSTRAPQAATVPQEQVWTHTTVNNLNPGRNSFLPISDILMQSFWANRTNYEVPCIFYFVLLHLSWKAEKFSIFSLHMGAVLLPTYYMWCAQMWHSSSHTFNVYKCKRPTEMLNIYRGGKNLSKYNSVYLRIYNLFCCAELADLVRKRKDTSIWRAECRCNVTTFLPHACTDGVNARAGSHVTIRALLQHATSYAILMGCEGTQWDPKTQR